MMRRLVITCILTLAGALWAQYPAGYFYIIFRGDTTCVRPVIVDAATEATWFNYTSASMHTGFEEPYETHFLFFYNPTTGNIGVVIQHNVDAGGTADCTCDLFIEGHPAACSLAISDDDGEFDLGDWPQGHWHWWDNTDGGAFYIPRSEFEFRMRYTFGSSDPIVNTWFYSDDDGSDHIFLANVFVGNEDTLILGHDFQGILEVPDTFDMGCLRLGRPETLYIPLCNSDSTSDTLHLGAVSPPDPSVFTILAYPAEIAPGECQNIVLLFTPSAIGDYSATMTIDMNSPCDSFRTINIVGNVVRGGLYPVWFWEETECDSANLVNICYEYFDCDPTEVTIRISDDGGISWGEAGEGWFVTFYDSIGDMGVNVMPDTHCFVWDMGLDHPGFEGCDWIVQATSYNETAGWDTAEAAGCLDSHFPEIDLPCPDTLWADSIWVFDWDVDDMFWTTHLSDILIACCDLDIDLSLLGDSYTLDIPLIDCDSCTLFVSITDSFCNTSTDTCVFVVECIPYLSRLRFMEETDCDSANIVTICYDLFDCEVNTHHVEVHMFEDSTMTTEIPMTTLIDAAEAIGPAIYPGYHCFSWDLRADYPDFEIGHAFLAIYLNRDTFYVHLADSVDAWGPIDSHDPEVTLTCPDLVFADSVWTFTWSVIDSFWNTGIADIAIFGCGLHIYDDVEGTLWTGIVPMMSCSSCTFIVTAADSFCNIGADTCIFQIDCVPYLYDLSISEETDCDDQNLVEICYNLFACDSVPHTIQVNLYADLALTVPIPLTTLEFDAGDIGEVYPGEHCFTWLMSSDYPGHESCNFTLEVILDHEYPDTATITDCLDSDPPGLTVFCPDDRDYIAGDTIDIEWDADDMFLTSPDGSTWVTADYVLGSEDMFGGVSPMSWVIQPTCDSIVLYAQTADSFCNIGYDTCSFHICTRLYLWQDCAPCGGGTSCQPQYFGIWIGDTVCGTVPDMSRFWYTAHIIHAAGGHDMFSSLDSLTILDLTDSVLITLDSIMLMDGDSFLFIIDSIYNNEDCRTPPVE